MFRSVGKGLTKLRGAVNSTQGRFAQLAGVAGLGALVQTSRTAVDELGKVSDKLGISTERLAGLQHAAELTGNSTRNLNLGLQRMVRRVAEAAEGTGEAQNALAELGLDAKELAQLSPDHQGFGAHCQ